MVVKLKPTWKIPTKPAREQSGHLRSAVGFAVSDNDGDFIGSRSRADDEVIYGPAAIGKREPNVMDPTPPKGDRRR